MSEEATTLQSLRELLLEGARSNPVGEADAAYFERLRNVIRGRSLTTPAGLPTTPSPESTTGS